MAGFLSQYNLDPGAAATLASVAGQGGPPVDPDSPEAWQAAIDRSATKPEEKAIARDVNTGARPAGPTGLPNQVPVPPHGDEDPAAAPAAAPAPQAEPEAPHANWGGAGGGGVMMPGGWQPHSAAATIKHGMTEGELSPLVSVQGQRLENAERLAEVDAAIGKQQGIRDAAYNAAKRAADQKHDDEWAALQRQRESYVAAKKDQLDQLATQAQAKVDPEAYWKEKGTLAQVASAIAIGMGSFAASINKGPNFALDIVNGAIDRNMRAQEANIRNAKQGFDVQSNLLAQNMQAFGDKEQALRVTRVMYLDQVASQLDEAMAASGLKDKSAGLKAKDAILAEREKYVKEYLNAAHDDVTEQQQNVYAQPKWVGGGGAPAKNLEHLVTLSDGTTVQMPTDKSQEGAIATIQEHNKLQAIDKHALELREQLRTMTPGTAAYDAAHTELKKLAIDRIYIESSVMGQGIVKKDEMEMQLPLSPYLRGIGAGFVGGYAQKVNPLADRDFNSGTAQIQAGIAQSNVQQRAIVKAAGGSIVDRRFQRDAAGNLAPVAKHTGQFVKPDQNQAPAGSVPMDPRLTPHNAPAKSLAQDTPAGPTVDAPAGTLNPTPAAKGGKGGK